KDGQPCALAIDHTRQIYHPSAHLRRRGLVQAAKETTGLAYHYWRCRADEKVPMQPAAWHRAEIVIAPSTAAALTPTLNYPQICNIEPAVWDELYQCGHPLKLRANSPLAQL